MSTSSCFQIASTLLARQLRSLSLNTIHNSRNGGATVVQGATWRSTMTSATRSALPAVATSITTNNSSSNNNSTTIRTFATKKKAKNNKKKTNKSKKKTSSAGKDNIEKKKRTPRETPLMHEEWVKFQQSIAVEGFETGQTMKVIDQTSKGTMRRDLAKQAKDVQAKLAERKRLTKVSGGHYPPARYSDEETERLLAEAYAAIPPRAGKRGTRNLRRQNRRWELVRQIRAKYKHHLAKFQERKMIKRSVKAAAVKKALKEAPVLRQRDREYQAQVFAKWASLMVTDREEADGQHGGGEDGDVGMKQKQSI